MDYSCNRNRQNQGQSNCSSCQGNTTCTDIDDMVLGMAYVPMQEWKQVFDPDKGLQSGTIFPDLVYNFYGCIPNGYYNNRKGGRN